MIRDLVVSIFLAVSALTHRAFITKDGIYLLDKGSFSPFKAYAGVNGKNLCFYEKTVSNRLLMTLRATDKNLEIYKSFIKTENYRACF